MPPTCVIKIVTEEPMPEYIENLKVVPKSGVLPYTTKRTLIILIILRNYMKKFPSALHLEKFRKVGKFAKKYNFIYETRLSFHQFQGISKRAQVETNGQRQSEETGTKIISVLFSHMTLIKNDKDE